MGVPSKYSELMKVDRRKQWKDLKKKHEKAISKAKLNFDQKLGPGLDKYQTQVEKIAKLAEKKELVSDDVDPVMTAATEVAKIATSYKTMVGALEPGPKKELGDLLTAIENDAHSWTELAVNTMGSVATGTTDAQKKAASSLSHELQNIQGICLMYVRRGPRALEGYKRDKKPAAILVTGRLVEAARTAGSACIELLNLGSKVAAGSNYELYKARAGALLLLVEKLWKQVEDFKKRWDINLDLADITMAGGDVDAMALEQSHDQMKMYCDSAVAKIKAMP